MRAIPTRAEGIAFSAARFDRPTHIWGQVRPGTWPWSCAPVLPYGQVPGEGLFERGQDRQDHH